MNLGAVLTIVAAVSLALVLVAFLLTRLMRWARSGSRSAFVVGAVLTDVTQGVVVSETKIGRKTKEGQAGDPPNDE